MISTFINFDPPKVTRASRTTGAKGIKFLQEVESSRFNISHFRQHFKYFAIFKITKDLSLLKMSCTKN